LVRENFYVENRFARFNLITIREHGILNFRAIQKGSVAALAIHHTAARRAAFHRKMQPGHERVLRQRKFSLPSGPPNGHTLARLEGDHLPRPHPCPNFQNYTHAEICPRSWIILR
jgi:hypothetical protein